MIVIILMVNSDQKEFIKVVLNMNFNKTFIIGAKAPFLFHLFSTS
jgi:hypothetical protein